MLLRHNPTIQLSLLPWLLFTLFTLFCWQDTLAESTRLPLINQTLPSFNLPLLSDPQKHLTNQMIKGHVSIINIWASWCSACQSEHSILMEIKEKYHIPIYGILYDDTPDAAKQQLNDSGNPYVIVAIDQNEQLSNALHLYGTPETLIIDQQGNIRYRLTGAMTEEIWTKYLFPLVQQLQK